MRQRDLRELLRRVAEDADPRSTGGESAQHRVRVRPRPDEDRRPVRGEPRQQRAPIPERLVEHGCCGFSIRGNFELDARPPRSVLEPRLPERARLGEYAVEVESEQEAWHG